MALKHELIEASSTVDLLQEIQSTKDLADVLINTKHYQQLGLDGIFAVVQKAKSLNINPLEALNGGLYYVQGRVEMSSQLMNQLIRLRGHSIQKDLKSTKELCILHGKRVDNGDTWSVSFGVEDAQKAGIYRQNSPWTKYTEAMCFARALSMLARQLFPDVIQGCYVEGELRDALQVDQPAMETQTLSATQIQHLEELIGDDDEYKKRLLDFFNIESFNQQHVSHWERLITVIRKHLESTHQEV